MTVTIQRMGKGYVLDTQQQLQQYPGQIFPFFGDANNLERLTPPWLNFKILTAGEIQMREGARLDYRIKLHGIPIRWRTEITAWEPNSRFIDEQIRGPYRWWIHEHTFIPNDEGTLVKDRVRYGLLGGGLVNALFVKKDLLRIFEYRQEQMQLIFKGR